MSHPCCGLWTPRLVRALIVACLSLFFLTTEGMNFVYALNGHKHPPVSQTICACMVIATVVFVIVVSFPGRGQLRFRGFRQVTIWTILLVTGLVALNAAAIRIWYQIDRDALESPLGGKGIMDAYVTKIYPLLLALIFINSMALMELGDPQFPRASPRVGENHETDRRQVDRAE